MAGGPVGGKGPNQVIEFVSNIGVVGPAFDASLIAAMDRPRPDTIIAAPKVVASGMVPPENVPT